MTTNTPALTASALIGRLMRDDEFAASCIKHITSDSGDINDYLQSQGYASGPEELLSAYTAEAAKDIAAWGGLYSFSSPGSYKSKKLKIFAQNGKLYLNDQLLEVTSKGDDRFEWKDGNAVAAVKFEAQYHDDGSAGANTFRGKLVTDTVEEDIAGKQEMTGTEWYQTEGIQTTSFVIGIIGLITIVKAIYDRIKQVKNPDKASPSIRDLQNKLQANKIEMENLAKKDLREVTNEKLAQLKKELLQELNAHTEGMTKKLLQDLPDLTYKPLEEQLKEIGSQMKDDLGEFVEKRLHAMLQPALEQALKSNPALLALESVISFQEDVKKEVLAETASAVNRQFEDRQLVPEIVAESIASEQEHKLREESQTIAKEQFENKEQRQRLAEEHEAGKQKVEELEKRLNEAKQEDRQDIQLELDAAIAGQTRIEQEKERLEREYEQKERDRQEKDKEADKKEAERKEAEKKKEEAAQHIDFKVKP